MKNILLFSLLLAMNTPINAAAQAFQDETSFLTIVVPTHFILKESPTVEDRYESTRNRSLLLLSKEYKGLEDSFLSAKSASSFNSQMLSADEHNVNVTVRDEKVGKLYFSIVSWSHRGKRNRITNHIRAYNDDGEFIHTFEMNSYNSNMDQLENAFRAFLKSCRPVK